MRFYKPLQTFADETGGVFTFDEIEAIPYNHWKKDYEWIVFIIDEDEGAFISVNALTAKEACETALFKYSLWKGDEDG